MKNDFMMNKFTVNIILLLINDVSSEKVLFQSFEVGALWVVKFVWSVGIVAIAIVIYEMGW